MHETQATITFDDGHSVVFEGFVSGPGYEFEGLRHFFLLLEGKPVVQYNGRLWRSGPSNDEARFVQLANDYPVERVVVYWEAATDYLNKAYRGTTDRPRELHRPWVLGTESQIHLQHIKAGGAPLP